VQALGGAKNHMVVMPDADLDQAVDALIGAAYGSAGERCMAISVAVLVGDAPTSWCPSSERAAALKVGNGMELAMPRWARSSPASRARRIEGYIDLGVREGAQLVVDGRGLKVAGLRGGFFTGGTLFDHVTPTCASTRKRSSARCWRACAPRTSPRRCSWSTTTSSATAWPASPATATWRASSRAASRSAWSASTCRSRCRWPGTASAAGRSSLFGDMHAYGEEGVRFYTKQKSVMQRWPESIAKGAEFVMPW
jgi:malonate-semialdehyde dehydrogenase (acetylating)/methylmalonate-semialdehyde dehydrogenase